MGVIRHSQTQRDVELSTETLVGRSRRCRVVIEHPLVSSLHAQLRWFGSQWILRDMSRNGTWVNGKAHRRDEAVALSAGDSICFGRNADPWVLLDASEPRALLTPLGGGPSIFLANGPVALPTDEDPRASIFLAPDGCAVMETAEERVVLTDGAELEVAGHRFQLQLATSQGPTATAGSTLEEAQLILSPSRHQEHVGVVLKFATHEQVLRPRVHFSLLLELARERLADHARGVPGQDAGWLHLEELCRRLRIDRPTFNTYAHRLRKQFGSTDLVDAVDIVQRRVDSDEVRLGCPNILIQSA